ncbi:MAG TPA: hypothetical protein VNQ56_11465 [Pseudolabrys sp.]|nr:hypothetical protein [Pseudolabrys sp.]
MSAADAVEAAGNMDKAPNAAAETANKNRRETVLNILSKSLLIINSSTHAQLSLSSSACTGGFRTTEALVV